MSNVHPQLVYLHRRLRNREEPSGVMFYAVLSDNPGDAMAQGLGLAMLNEILPTKPIFIEAIEALGNHAEVDAAFADPDPGGYAVSLVALQAWDPFFWDHLRTGGDMVWRVLDFDGMTRWAEEEPADAEWLAGRMRQGEYAGELAKDALALRFMEFVEQSPILAAMAETAAPVTEGRSRRRL